MTTSLETFIAEIKQGRSVAFKETMDLIAQYYDYRPTRFVNGLDDDRVVNEAGSNEGSCKIFYFGRLHELSEKATLALFGEHYAEVLSNPNGDSHKNIRAFMRYGWRGISFDGEALARRSRDRDTL
ncbi:HopJ type III effector protein [Methylocaldum marinum]|uniref:HopJ type III effector protein n=1 Tax=Methylocaldum marinum TaxID=1432792 RepID=A0A250L2F9_9GAMM|nr:HopJ type III effector protein [Methylocaldum marinum]BBA36669.1 HopJ type III effector protein [Methylocaldum marinum]